MSEQKPVLDAATIARISYPGKSIEGKIVQQGQAEHRIDIISQWDINPGDHVLELGCGQGDATAVLAAAVGASGTVTALDPADLDYGNPFTLGQAQSHLKNGPLGSCITFVQADPIDFLQAPPPPEDTNPEPGKPRAQYTHAILAHCSFYFSSPAVLAKTLSLLAGRAQRICIAEYALLASRPTAQPHLLAVLTQASLECRKPVSTSNIRTVLSPAAIKDYTQAAGLTMLKERVKTPPDGMFDGRWEVSHVMEERFAKEVEDCVKDEREKSVVFALRDAVRANRDFVKASGQKLSTMDVWVASFAKQS